MPSGRRLRKADAGPPAQLNYAAHLLYVQMMSDVINFLRLDVMGIN
jgi:hypothetical protein